VRTLLSEHGEAEGVVKPPTSGRLFWDLSPRSVLRALLAGALATLLFGLAAPRAGTATEHGESAPPKASTPVIYDVKIIRAYPHDPEAFTQGLLFDGGFLYESTGLKGRSSLRKVELETGKVLQLRPLPPEYFGEGLAARGQELIQLTWKSGLGFVYSKSDFTPRRQFGYATEGWGITWDGERFIMSDGSSVLRFLDPHSFTETGRLAVRENGGPEAMLNELEFIKGEIFANIWQKDLIVRISPTTGDVVGKIDCGVLRAALGPTPGAAEALNGIAFDAAHNRVFVTGKLWPKLFEIELIPRK
jgi:glutamine cyclotransferase